MDYPTYDPASNVAPLTEPELEALDELLQSLPADGAMTIDGVDGYLTALLVAPKPLADWRTADWLPAIWGGDAPPDDASSAPASWPFASNQKKKRTTVLALRHLRAIAAQLATAPDDWEPIFNVADLPDEDGGELADATDWCLGFLAAIDLAPPAWAALQADPDLGPALAAIARLGGDSPAVEGEDLDDPVVRDELSRSVAELVPVLWARRPGA